MQEAHFFQKHNKPHFKYKNPNNKNLLNVIVDESRRNPKGSKPSIVIFMVIDQLSTSSFLKIEISFHRRYSRAHPLNDAVKFEQYFFQLF